ncbi:MAG TPA: glycosyltransferase [Solirubrobacteraceae bacterium]|nr:glycosyltransferase [Solirubrobacteraceae bacterium]
MDGSMSGAGERGGGRAAVLAHDYLLVMRGAERVFSEMARMYPDAPIITLLYDERATGAELAGHEVLTSPLQRLGAAQHNFRRLLPLYPWAVGRMRVPDCELLLSSSSAFMHGLRAPAGAVHVCYCHAPFRYAWYEQQRALEETPAPLRVPLRGLLAAMRRWDAAASRRVDRYVANSRLTQEQIARFYGRKADVVHPPVDTERFRPREDAAPGEHLLIVSELVRHKRLDVALAAARQAGAPIRVAGSGPEHDALARAYPEAEFLGRVSDEQLELLYAQARAVLVPSMEEFGITAVEAQAAGRPVIAAAAGGALETVLDGATGRLVPLGDVRAFTAAISELDGLGLRPADAVSNASRFSIEAFRRGLGDQIARALDAGARRR